jgi:hypothetical protein
MDTLRIERGNGWLIGELSATSHCKMTGLVTQFYECLSRVR